MTSPIRTAGAAPDTDPKVAVAELLQLVGHMGGSPDDARAAIHTSRLADLQRGGRHTDHYDAQLDHLAVLTA